MSVPEQPTFDAQQLLLSVNKPEQRKVLIEKATSEDIKAIVDLIAEVSIATFQGATPELTEAALRLHFEGDTFRNRRIEKLQSRLQHPDQGISIVARSRRELSGYGAADIDEEGKRHVHLYVPTGENQVKGVGSAILTQVLKWHGPRNDIFIDVVTGTPGIGYLERNGFQKTGEKWSFILEGGVLLPQTVMRLQGKSPHLVK